MSFWICATFSKFGVLVRLHWLSGDMTDLASLIEAVRQSDPDEVYNLAAQSFVATSSGSD
jgi:GDPmannose 4,6-dehydratase